MIDTSLDLRSDSSGEADTYSHTLRRYHRLLWSKRLPSGSMFDLEEAGRKGCYLRHSSGLGEFKLSSDAITNRLLRRAKRVIAQIPPEQLLPHRGYTIGSPLLFPKTAPPGRRTINQARGMNTRIADRCDLTLECIRRHYRRQDSPLASTLSEHANFFALFEDFAGYIDFWLLQDLVEDDGKVRFWLPFNDFEATQCLKTSRHIKGTRRVARTSSPPETGESTSTRVNSPTSTRSCWSSSGGLPRVLNAGQVGEAPHTASKFASPRSSASGA